MSDKKCQCDTVGKLSSSRMAELYNPVKELPYVNHEPRECQCTNELRDYIRGDRVITLCSCCCLRGDVPL